jgi:ferredoxin
MHHSFTKALYEGYSLEDKSDSLAGYLYLKYIRYFLYYALKLQGEDVEPPDEVIDESIAEMLQMLVQQVADSTMSYDTNNYHGKVLKVEDARKIITLEENINITPSERVMPYKLVRQLLIENPGSIAAAPCVCRSFVKDPCYPNDKEICLFVGDPHASFMAEQHSKARMVSQDEALHILEIAHDNGFVHTAYFNKFVGNRLYALCNCCKCCCGSMKAWNMYEGAIPLIVSSGYVSDIGKDCTGCGECMDACHFNAISLDEENEIAVLNIEKCMGCGICADICPAEAISLKRDPSKGDPMDIHELQKQ